MSRSECPIDKVKLNKNLHLKSKYEMANKVLHHKMTMALVEDLYGVWVYLSVCM